MERLIELINFIGQTPIENSAVHLSVPIVSSKLANTVVVIDGQLTAGAYGHFQFRYNRHNLDDMAEREIAVESETTLLALLPKINGTPIFTYTVGSGNETFKKKAFLLTQDIVNETIGTLAPGSTTHITLQAAPKSYLFTGFLKLRLTKL